MILSTHIMFQVVLEGHDAGHIQVRVMSLGHMPLSQGLTFIINIYAMFQIYNFSGCGALQRNVPRLKGGII